MIRYLPKLSTIETSLAQRCRATWKKSKTGLLKVMPPHISGIFTTNKLLATYLSCTLDFYRAIFIEIPLVRRQSTLPPRLSFLCTGHYPHFLTHGAAPLSLHLRGIEIGRNNHIEPRAMRPALTPQKSATIFLIASVQCSARTPEKSF